MPRCYRFHDRNRRARWAAEARAKRYEYTPDPSSAAECKAAGMMNSLAARAYAAPPPPRNPAWERWLARRDFGDWLANVAFVLVASVFGLAAYWLLLTTN